MNPLGGKDENSKHIAGISGKSRFQCPNCGHGFKGLTKAPMLISCSKCKKVIDGNNLIENE